MNNKPQLKLDVKVSFNVPELVDTIEYFSDKVVYNVAVLTREMTKNLRAFPRLTGKLEQEEVASHIIGNNKEYGLIAGVDYAVSVWNFGENTAWTNPNTQTKWYYSVYDRHEKEIVNNAVDRVLKEV